MSEYVAEHGKRRRRKTTRTGPDFDDSGTRQVAGAAHNLVCRGSRDSKEWGKRRREGEGEGEEEGEGERRHRARPSGHVNPYPSHFRREPAFVTRSTRARPRRVHASLFCRMDAPVTLLSKRKFCPSCARAPTPYSDTSARTDSSAGRFIAAAMSPPARRRRVRSACRAHRWIARRPAHRPRCSTVPPRLESSTHKAFSFSLLLVLEAVCAAY